MVWTTQNFRKEAIFRRMRQYMREKERAESRVAELEKRKLELEGAMVSIEDCWNQVIYVLTVSFTL